jgi:PAS domain-containing protein
MPQQAIEIILIRQWAAYLAMPVFVVDPEGTLLFYNEPAEAILGRRFDETGAMPADEWSVIFEPTDEEGVPLPPEALPLMIALSARRPAHRCFAMTGLDGVLRRLEVTAFPIIGQGERFLGAMALFWEMAG